MSDVTQILDVRDQSCPLPIVRAAQAIAKLDTGDTLEILATDRGAISDVPSWCETTGHQLLDKGEEDGVFRFLVRKG